MENKNHSYYLLKFDAKIKKKYLCNMNSYLTYEECVNQINIYTRDEQYKDCEHLVVFILLCTYMSERNIQFPRENQGKK